MNYAASIAYGALAIAILFAAGYVDGSVLTMRCAVVCSALAFTSCYFGYAYEHDGSYVWFVISLITTLLALCVYVFGLVNLG